MIQMLEWSKFLSLINTPGEILYSIPRINTSQDIVKKAADLANANGGYLLLGYDRFGPQLIGCTFDGKWLEAILSSEIKPAINYNIMGFIRNNKRLFAVKIEEGAKKPYSIHSTNSAPAVTKPEKKVEDDISQESVKRRQARCLDYLENNPDITNSKYREINEVSYKTAHNELSDLVDKKMLGQIGQARTTKYVLYKNLESAEIPQPEEAPNLFGETLESFIDNQASLSRTEIRKTQNAEQMENHFTRNVVEEIISTATPEDSCVVPEPDFDF